MERLDFLNFVTAQYKVLLRACNKPVDLYTPEDIVQQMITEVLSKKKYKGINPSKGSPVGWLVTVVRNKMFSLLKRQLLEQSVFISMDELSETGKREFKNEQKAQVEMSTDYIIAMSRLTVLERQIVEAIYLGIETYESLSTVLGLEEIQLREAGRTARKKLQKAFAPKSG